MRDNPDYALDDVEAVRALVRENPWATIVSHVPGEGLVASHYPVLLEEDAEGVSIVSHVGRPDERLHRLGEHETMVIVYGPQGYVSPGWYGSSPAVPTWDFAVAHLFGTPEILSDEENLAVLDRLVAWFESPLPDPFLMRRTLENTAYAERIVHGTVGFRLRATRIEAKEKMHQDKSPEVIARVVEALRRPGPYENPKLADRIADVNRDVLDGKGRDRMTAFVGVGDMVEWISRRGAEQIMTEMADTIEADFRRWESFDKSERVANHTPFGVIELMPISDPDVYAFKYVNGHPFNPGRGYQTVTAFGVLADVHNGYPVFLAEMTVLTALRTAATSAMVARKLARPDSSTMAMIGAGSQAEFQALAFRGVLGVSRLRIYDVDPAASAKFVRNLAPHGFDITVCASASEAAVGADIVTTCTADKAVAQVLTDADVAPGMHINTIGGDCPGKTELDPRILDRGPVFVEYTPQTRVEGEIQNVAADFPVTEFWQVLNGTVAGRTSPEQVTIFDSVGFAIEDFSALRHLRADLAGTGLDTEIDLVAAPEDPKDLFGFATSPVPVT